MQYDQKSTPSGGAAAYDVDHDGDADVLIVDDGVESTGDSAATATATTDTFNSEPSLGQLFSDLSRQASTLVREEVALAKTEMSQIATEAGSYLGYLVVGGLIAYAGLLALMAGVIILLGRAIDPWIAALLVGLLTAAIGGAMAKHGMDQLKRMDFTPDETIESLKEDKEWLKRQV